MWACTQTPASQPGFVQSVPSVSVQRGSVWLSPRFSATQRPVRTPSVACGSQNVLWHTGISTQGAMVTVVAVLALKTFARSEGLLCAVPQKESAPQTPSHGRP